MALGSQKYNRVEPGVYKLIVDEALRQGIDVIESGQDDGQIKLAEALLGYEGQKRLKVLCRFGYNVVHSKTNEKPPDSVIVDSVPESAISEPTQVIHTLNGQIVESFLKDSPLMDLVDENLDIVPMIHNPEEHGDDTLGRLTDAFCALEEAVSKGEISSFGLVSNGLSLPTDHPLHLDWRSVVMKAAAEAAKQTSKEISNLSILQLPANILETRGMKVARDVYAFMKGRSDPYLPQLLELYAMRPLTCYPDQGTRSPHGFQMIDYPIPTEPGVTEWTHEMKNVPPVYPATFKTALSFFDATDLLEIKQERRLTDEEEETLEGANILLDLVKDLDRGLEDASCFSKHEEELLSQVVPVLDGTFEEIDEESLKVLQNFFASYGLAARYYIARNTRSLIMKGGEGVEPYEIPSDMTMQDFAIRELLKEPFAKVVVGCTKPEHVRDNMEIFNLHAGD
jgi:hypothetical protein